MTKKSPINFDRTIAGVNITENGIKSYTKSFKLGPFQLTLNARESGVQDLYPCQAQVLANETLR
jgi:hypothetical protein